MRGQKVDVLVSTRENLSLMSLCLAILGCCPRTGVPVLMLVPTVTYRFGVYDSEAEFVREACEGPSTRPRGLCGALPDRTAAERSGDLPEPKPHNFLSARVEHGYDVEWAKFQAHTHSWRYAAVRPCDLAGSLLSLPLSNRHHACLANMFATTSILSTVGCSTGVNKS